ncbi:MAG: type II toxin-antitoxin system VapC family toxin [Devosia sp.]|nr:type II toxin-antitoxin system VapC family toxin [Devosia sp.]
MRFVLDASALLAAMRREKGGEAVVPLLPGAMITTVNVVEAGTRLLDFGDDPEVVLDGMYDYGLTVVPFDFGLAADAIRLRASTRAAGLSLGDRACLALAVREKAVALTADRAWARIDVGCEIKLIR